MLDDAGHLGKSDRRGKKGTDWAKTHLFFINEWNMRHERFQATFDHATASMTSRMNPGYMAWYNRITVTYLTQPGIQSTAGMNESASSLRFLVETLQGVWHLTDEHETDPRMRQIREMVGKALQTTNHTDVMEYPASQRRDVAMSHPPPHDFTRPTRRGVGGQTGGHSNTRHYRMSQPQPEYVEPEPLNPEYDPPGWSIYPGQESQSQWSGPSHGESQWNAARASCDSFFHDESYWNADQASRDSFFEDYQIMTAAQEEEEGDDNNDEEEDEVEDEEVPRPAGEGSSRPAAKGSSRSFIGKAVNRAIRGLSTRKNKGKIPSKYTPSAYK